MKHIKIILGLILFASVTTFAQSPRIKLNQITKDTVKGSVLISSPTDSGMVYSRDFYVAYGADTVLILYGDTLAATSGIISSVLSDGVTITGNGTSGNELKVDTLLIATIKALNDSLATISASTTPDGVTITGDGSVGNPLKVDTLFISTIQGLVDTLTNRGYLTANQTITLSGDVTGSGTTAITATVVDDSHDHIISNVDFLQDSLTAKVNASELSNYVTLAGTETITGAKTFTSTVTGTRFDPTSSSTTGNGMFLPTTNTLGFSTNGSEQMRITSGGNVGIGTTIPLGRLEIADVSQLQTAGAWTSASLAFKQVNGLINDHSQMVFGYNSGTETYGSAYIGFVEINQGAKGYGDLVLGTRAVNTDTQPTERMRINYDGDVGIGTSSPASKLTLKTKNDTYAGGFRIEGTDETTALAITHVNGDNYFSGNATNDHLVLTGSGNVGIGKIPSENLDVNGKVKIGDLTGTGGNAVYENGGVLGVASDARFKSHIADLDNGIEKILNLKPKYFIDNRNSAFQQLGFYAQEVKSVINEASYPIGNTEYYGINDRAIIAVTVKAIQEQQAIIESQASEIETLKSQIQLILNEIEQLKNN